MPAAQHDENLFKAIHYRWPVARTSRRFNIKVVEPGKYAPAEHTELFLAAMTQVINPVERPVDGVARRHNRPIGTSFDLTTFPEAFVDSDTLVKFLTELSARGANLGCVHVGLRPSAAANHLFSAADVEALVSRLRDIPQVDAGDLNEFSGWLTEQRPADRFNLACLFTVARDGKLRICLHPKLVASRFEMSALPDNNLTEANLLSLVTLDPRDKEFLTVTLQPIICSDALDQETDRPGGGPLTAVNRHAGCFADPLPDHVDIISVSTCTPQRVWTSSAGGLVRGWHENFRGAFQALQQNNGYDRHRHAAMVLANFRTVDSGKEGGVSGVFMPVPPPALEGNEGLTLSCYGQSTVNPRGNEWSEPQPVAPMDWQSLGYVIGVDAYAGPEGALIKIFSFTLRRLPRDAGRWAPPAFLHACDVSVGTRAPDGTVRFDLPDSANDD